MTWWIGRTRSIPFKAQSGQRCSLVFALLSQKRHCFGMMFLARSTVAQKQIDIRPKQMGIVINFTPSGDAHTKCDSQARKHRPKESPTRPSSRQSGFGKLHSL